jgi:hypothetical protein
MLDQSVRPSGPCTVLSRGSITNATMREFSIVRRQVFVKRSPTAVVLGVCHATGVNASPAGPSRSCSRRQCSACLTFLVMLSASMSRAIGAGVLRPRPRRQYRPASYSQAKSKCVIANKAGYRPLRRPASRGHSCLLRARIKARAGVRQSHKIKRQPEPQAECRFPGASGRRRQCPDADSAGRCVGSFKRAYARTGGSVPVH